MNHKVLVGVSGGVDSCVSLYILKEQGFEVVGATLDLFECSRVGEKSCCRQEDKLLAKSVCDDLEIPHVMIDAKKTFKNKVIEPFVESYLKGLTPNPCVLCNRYLKFDCLWKYAQEMGCDYIATGHYARVGVKGKKVHEAGSKNQENRVSCFVLRTGVDPQKDQSYFLFMLDPEILSHTIFPLGNMTKDEVRKIAKKAGLSTHSKQESQEVCFVPDDDYVGYLEQNYSDRLLGRGKFVNADKEVLGHHRGIHAYTIGQRRHLGISLGKRQYVTRIDREKNEVVIGDEASLYSKRMVVGMRQSAKEKAGNKINPPAPFSSKGGSASGGSKGGKGDFLPRLLVKIRYSHEGSMASINVLDDGKVEVIFDEPQRAITPGQAAVFYDGDVVVGGGWIE